MKLIGNKVFMFEVFIQLAPNANLNQQCQEFEISFSAWYIIWDKTKSIAVKCQEKKLIT